MKKKKDGQGEKKEGEVRGEVRERHRERIAVYRRFIL